MKITEKLATNARLGPITRRARMSAGATLQAARGAGEEAQVVDHERDLVLAECVDRLAGVVGLQLGELVGVLLNRIGELEQRSRALAGRRDRPALEGSARGFDGAVNVGCRRQRGVRNHLTGRRVEHRFALTVRGRHVRPVDEVLKLCGGSCRHTERRYHRCAGAPTALILGIIKRDG